MAGIVTALALGIASLGALGCQGRAHATSPERAVAAPAAPPSARPAAGPFDGRRAHEDLSSLASIEDRHPGSRGAEKARKRLRRSLSRSDLEVIDVETLVTVSPGGETAVPPEPVVVTHLLARPENDDRDAILLVAPYDVAPSPGGSPSGANAGASGAAVLLELARLDEAARKAGAELPLALWFALIDGDGPTRSEASAPAGAAATPYPGSVGFVRWLEAWPDANRIRLVVFIDRVADPHLEVARDLHSNGAYRDVFFAEAVARDHPAFDASLPPSAPMAGHRAFADAAVSPVVAIIGSSAYPSATWRDRDATDGSFEETSEASLFAVGDTVWAALARIADRLVRIDAFRADPLRAAPGEVDLPGAGDPAEPSGAVGETGTSDGGRAR